MTDGTIRARAETRLVGLRLDPLDVLFFRDGRPFTPAGHGESSLPLPQTLAGALRARLLEEAGCDVAAFARLDEMIAQGCPLSEAAAEVCGAGWIGQVAVRGPWFCRAGASDDCVEDVLVAVPASLHQAKHGERGGSPQLVRLDPLRQPLPGWQPLKRGMRPLWKCERAATEPAAGFLTLAGLRTFLSGGTPAADDRLPPGDVYDFDRRTGIGVSPDHFTAEEGMIYGVRLLALKRRFAFYAEVRLPAEAPIGTLAAVESIPFGGEGRRVRMSRVKPWDWKLQVEPGEGQGRLVLLTTAGLFDARGTDGWVPDCLAAREGLVSAAVSGFTASSGWNMASGGPKPNRFAVPAGSVYFLDRTTGDDLPEESLADAPEDRLLGWGCYLTGVWNDA